MPGKETPGNKVIEDIIYGSASLISVIFYSKIKNLTTQKWKDKIGICLLIAPLADVPLARYILTALFGCAILLFKDNEIADTLSVVLAKRFSLKRICAKTATRMRNAYDLAAARRYPYPSKKGLSPDMTQKELLITLHSLWLHPRAGRRDISAFQNKKLRYLIRHAYKNVVYYRRLLDEAGIDPQSILAAEDLLRIPITQKSDLRANPLEEILARGARPERLVCRITSGSSGCPFVVRRTWPEEHIINMFRVRAEQQYGMRLLDKTALVSAANVPGQRCKTSLTAMRQAACIHRSYRVDCLQPVEAMYRRLEEIDPDILSGYPGALAVLAAFAKGKFSKKKLRFIICGGESLTLAKRKIIEDAFGVRAFDVLGTNECNIVSWECPHTGLYHVCDDNIVAEVIRDGQPVKEGEQGELVITSLHSYAMPFIRYRMGDMVIKGPDRCPCGQPFSTFQSIAGRIREYFLLPDGRRVHPLEAVMPVITECAPWLDRFQMTQETKTNFVLLVTLMRKPAPEEIQSFSSMVARRLGQGAEFRIEIADNIPFEANGKFKDCRSLIQPDEDTDQAARRAPSDILKNVGPDGLMTTTFPSYGLRQHYILAHSPLDRFDATAEAIAKNISEGNYTPLFQTIFAPCGFMPRGLRSIEASLSKPKRPVTWLEYPRGNGERACGIQTYAVSGSRIQPMKFDDGILGNVFESAYARFCFLGNIAAPGATLTNPAQAKCVFEKIDSALKSIGMEFGNVMRTWFYLNDILSWYPEFNKVRNAFFSERGIYRTRIPASTAVGMSNPSGAGIIANAMAIQPKGENICINEVASPLQCPAPDYNNTFSRAIEVTMPDSRYLYVSGTASIDANGLTAHAKDVDKQIGLTFKVVQSILSSRAMGWSDVARAVAYFKDLDDAPRLSRYLRQNGLHDLPLVMTQADICREDLLFELDADAMTRAEK